MSVLRPIGSLPGRLCSGSGKRQSSSVHREGLRSQAAVTAPFRSQFEVTLSSSNQSITLPVLVDSGADANFIDRGLVVKLGIKTIPLSHPMSVNGLSGRLVDCVEHTTIPLNVLLSGNHRESLSFHVIDSSLCPVVLGLPWLKNHNPQID